MKEEIFELIKEAIKELLHTYIIMYPAGSVSQEEAKKIGVNPICVLEIKYIR